MQTQQISEPKSCSTTTTTIEHDLVAKAALATFRCLQGNGKPQPHEYTVLSAIGVSYPCDPNKSSLPAVSPHHNNRSPDEDYELAVICLATGTKCLPASQRTPDGSALNDMHAEVLCRRAFVRWLIEEIEAAAVNWNRHHHLKAAAQKHSSNKTGPDEEKMIQSAASDDEQARYSSGTRIIRLIPPPSSLQQQSESSPSSSQSSLFEWKGWRVDFQSGVKLHMFVSQPPCGDASILGGSVHNGSKLNTSTESQQQQPLNKACSSSGGGEMVFFSGRTGAKPLIPILKEEALESTVQHHADDDGLNTSNKRFKPSEKGSEWRVPSAYDVESYDNIQRTGVIRRKPGKGEPTLSMSCSDKIAKWTMLGLQGALLSSLFTHTVLLETISIGLAVDSFETVVEPGSTTSQQQQQSILHTALCRAFIDRVAPLKTLINQQNLYGSNDAHSYKDKTTKPTTITVVSLHLQELQSIGFAPGEARKVPSGSSMVWRAPTSPHWKPHKTLIHGSTGSGNNTSTTTSTNNDDYVVLSGGTLESASGATGIRLGVSRKGGRAIKPGARLSVCKGEILTAFVAMKRVVASLHHSGGGDINDANPSIDNDKQCTYRELKERIGRDYTTTWKALVKPPSLFEAWIPKPPELETFSVAGVY